MHSKISSMYWRHSGRRFGVRGRGGSLSTTIAAMVIMTGLARMMPESVKAASAPPPVVKVAKMSKVKPTIVPMIAQVCTRKFGIERCESVSGVSVKLLHGGMQDDKEFHSAFTWMMGKVDPNQDDFREDMSFVTSFRFGGPDLVVGKWSCAFTVNFSVGSELYSCKAAK